MSRSRTRRNATGRRHARNTETRRRNRSVRGGFFLKMFLMFLIFLSPRRPRTLPVRPIGRRDGVRDDLIRVVASDGLRQDDIKICHRRVHVLRIITLLRIILLLLSSSVYYKYRFTVRPPDVTDRTRRAWRSYLFVP